LGATVVSVFADYQFHYPAAASDVETTSFCLLQFRNGVRFEMELGSAWMYPKPRFHVRGANGGFRKYGVDPQEAAIKLGAVGVPVPEDPARYQMKIQMEGGVREVSVEPVPGRYRTYYDNIGQALMGNAELLVKPAECLEAVRVIDAIVASAEQGVVQKITEKGEEEIL
jgi:predicted dehydrogenase